jgi:hypothetical protein
LLADCKGARLIRRCLRGLCVTKMKHFTNQWTVVPAWPYSLEKFVTEVTELFRIDLIIHTDVQKETRKTNRYLSRLYRVLLLSEIHPLRILTEDWMSVFSLSFSTRIPTNNRYEDDCLLGCCGVWSRRNWDTFQMFLLPQQSG